MVNTQLHTQDIELISKDTFRQGIFLAYQDGITSVAPLGFSGDTIVLFGEGGAGRISQVSVRNYSNNAELLITDAKGAFLFLGRYDINLGVEFVCEQYWQIFCLLKDKIEGVLPRACRLSDMKKIPDMTFSDGFDMMRAYQELMNSVNVNGSQP